MLKIYVSHKMTGRTGKELNKEMRDVFYIAYPLGIQILDPIEKENIPDSNKVVRASPRSLKYFWAQDKRMMREAHVLIDLSGPQKSVGCEKEAGFFRYYLWRPVIRVWPDSPYNVAWLEDDLVVGSVEEAMFEAHSRWGTWPKRTVWRAKLLRRCFTRFLMDQLGGLK